MKNWIKTYLRESLEEMTIKPKKEFGKGAYHKVYASNKYPDRLFKIGDEDTVHEWLSTFQENPKYFPKVYRTFPFRKDPTLTVVEIEKLNTAVAAKELKEIDEFLLDISDTVHCGKNFLSLGNFYETPCINMVVSAANDSDNPYLIPILQKWTKFLRAVAPIIEKNLGRPLDLHIGNVAYDKMGKLKMIDI